MFSAREIHMSKSIIVQWIPVDNDPFYKTEMRVVVSDHPKFDKGSRFDYGFFGIATMEGYVIISLPPKQEVKKDDET